MQSTTLKQLSLSKTKNHFILKIFFVFTLFTILSSSFSIKDKATVSEKINDNVTFQIDSIVHELDVISSCFKINGTLDSTVLIKAKLSYESARKSFKEIEFYTEFYFPFYSKYFINGPLVSKAELEYGYKTFSPHGFQLVESYLYSKNTDSLLNIVHEINLLKQSLYYIKQQSISKKTSQTTVVDMLRFELIRIMSLYLNGYDCTVNKQNLKEIKYILINTKNEANSISNGVFNSTNINNSVNYLNANTNYDDFNRLYFIVNYLKPIYEELYFLYPKEAFLSTTHFAINIREQKFYSSSWFNKNYFTSILKDSLLQVSQAQLGKLLFFDPILSGNNLRACASCHDVNSALGGSEAFNFTFDKKSKLKRNTPSILNSVFQKSFFNDGRSLQLEDQALEVLLNHSEMAANPKSIIYKLRQSKQYMSYFKKAFNNTEDTAITIYGIVKSISEYERSLTSLNSRFDNYIKGDTSQLTKNELEGYAIFSGKALCGSCHFFPLFNGLVPPFYSDNEFEVIGVSQNKLNKKVDIDSGRYHVTKNPIHITAFKTPNIRNIEHTAPYMHNGIYASIDEVIDFYQRGGGNGFGYKLENQTLPFDSLQLTKADKQKLKRFLLSLTDKKLNLDVPKKLPYVNIKGIESRKVGGTY